MNQTLHYKLSINEHGEITRLTLPAREFAFGTQNRFLLDEAFVFTERSETCLYATEDTILARTEKLVMHVVCVNLKNISRMETANKKLLSSISKGE